MLYCIQQIGKHSHYITQTEDKTMKRPIVHTAQFSFQVVSNGKLPDSADYEIVVEGSIECIPAEYEDGFLFYPATNEVDEPFKVIEVVRDGIPLAEFDQTFWDAMIDEKELGIMIQEFDPVFNDDY